MKTIPIAQLEQTNAPERASSLERNSEVLPQNLLKRVKDSLFPRLSYLNNARDVAIANHGNWSTSTSPKDTDGGLSIRQT